MSTPPKLLPKTVLPFAPLRHDERLHYLNLLYKQYRLANSQFHNNKDSNNALIVKSVSKEYSISKECKSKMEYLHVVKKIMFNLKKYGLEEINSHTKESSSTLSKNNINNTNNNGTIPNASNAVTENLNSNELPKTVELRSNENNKTDDFTNIYNELKDLCVPFHRLKRHNYVMDIPSDSKNDHKFQDTINCAHCGTIFRLCDIKNIVNCTFHPGKRITTTYENLNKGKKIYGTDYASKFYSCCNEPIGQSNGCSKLNHHVYKFDNPLDLHKSKPFVKINQLRKKLDIKEDSKANQLRKEKIKAIALDCEMCYTDKGFEMMKLSVIDFKTEKKLIDSIIHPDGELIIDLNSHVSGVDSIPKDALTFDEVMIKLAYLTDENTIIVGHGLENDLNVLRLIYPKIVDTAILFSENQVNVRRKDPLKKLAWTYLSENIQGKEHDSLEDALVPTRIVKKHIKKILKRKQMNILSQR